MLGGAIATSTSTLFAIPFKEAWQDTATGFQQIASLHVRQESVRKAREIANRQEAEARARKKEEEVARLQREIEAEAAALAVRQEALRALLSGSKRKRVDVEGA